MKNVTPQITDINEIIRLLTKQKMVLHAPSSPKRNPEITIIGDDCVESETTSAIFEYMQSSILAKRENYSNLVYVQMQEPGCGATWCIIAKDNEAAMRHVIADEPSTKSKVSKEGRNVVKLRGIIDQVNARKTKGWAFGPGTDAEKIEKINEAHKQIESDFNTMSRADFVTKYSDYLTKPDTRFLLANRSDADIEKENAARIDQQIADTLEKFPPNRKFYSFTNLTDEKWHRYDTMPSDEELMARKAIRWNARVIGLASGSRSLGNFCITGIHKDGLVIEFEYVYVKGKLYDPNIH